MLGAVAACAQDIDALSLQPDTPAEVAAPAASPLRVAVEAAVGHIDERVGPGLQRGRDGRRVSLDLRYLQRVGDAWRFSLSDRLDDTHPAPISQHSTVNSLREAYAGWQAESSSAELGRINLRQGPAYGFNPTDYFRSGGLRTVTTADPITLREMRMGTVMLRAGQLWTQGGVSVALAPKLANHPDQRGAALDLGATNAHNRAMAAVDHRFSERFNAQASVLLEQGRSPRLGASLTTLATDSLVGYAEWATGRMPSLADQVAGVAKPQRRVDQAAAGFTYTLPGGLAVTLEGEYNGAGLTRNEWNALAAQGPAAYGRYVQLTQPGQELGSRRAALVYVSYKGLGMKQLDFTGFVRSNVVDDSRLAWAELRYRWTRFDAAVQWQRSLGRAGTEFGSMPYRQLVQLLGVFYL